MYCMLQYVTVRYLLLLLLLPRHFCRANGPLFVLGSQRWLIVQQTILRIIIGCRFRRCLRPTSSRSTDRLPSPTLRRLPSSSSPLFLFAAALAHPPPPSRPERLAWAVAIVNCRRFRSAVAAAASNDHPDRRAVHRWPLSTGFLADKTYTGVASDGRRRRRRGSITGFDGRQAATVGGGGGGSEQQTKCCG
jgi:hypothetical protein